MIQRKQTIFLLLAVVAYVVTLLLPGVGSWLLVALLVGAAAVSLLAIFDYNHRPRQSRLCLVAMVVTLLWYLVLALQAADPSARPLSAVLPAVALVLLALARKGILDDERLVRAADRLR